MRSSTGTASQIEAERSRRLAYQPSGMPLPGTPDLADLAGRLAAQGLALGAPVFMRIFKREFELELWMRRDDRFQRFAVYPICRWSGELGPKLAQGDAQAPEGFYTVDAKALNPQQPLAPLVQPGLSQRLRPRARPHGSLLMVHGGCASIGCYAMTDPVIDEIWRLVTAALNGGQTRFHVHVFPFRMTDEAMAYRDGEAWLPFWQNLKLGHDLFEASKRPPRVFACAGQYAFAPGTSGSDGSADIEAHCPDLTKPKS